jgi:hypothetical protein
MTRKRSKKIMLEVWTYFRDHPEIKSKDDLPEEILKKIDPCMNKCPLCNLFLVRRGYCPACILDRCYNKTSTFHKWEYAKTPKTRAKYAGLIVQAVEEWDV